VVVLPEYQGTGVGKCLVKRYIEYIRTAGIPAERIILLCHDYLIRFYESAGFENRGLSQCRYAGETWYDMVSSKILRSFFYGMVLTAMEVLNL
jgi:GNAT superfamily N-acetyltransferase